ncbi:MAG: hypothetical protein M1829_004865 [Trizodia sp. TS-e1964]|nr:MAG: hypothetical protein M1829_004865 [Trizodia sp. TS-e1964]
MPPDRLESRVAVRAFGILTRTPPLPDMTDYFHSPYPPFPTDVLSLHAPTLRYLVAGRPRAAADPTASLPQEVFDQVFGHLSLSALDSARFVCRNWYERIMTNPHLLSQSLVSPIHEKLLTAEGNGMSYMAQVRTLAKAFEVQCKRPTVCSQEDSFRVSYRRCDSIFSTPTTFKDMASGVPSETTFVSATLSLCGYLIAFITHTVAQGSSQTPGQYAVLVYYMFSTGEPQLIAAIPCPIVKGIPRRIEIHQDVTTKSWLAIITLSHPNPVKPSLSSASLEPWDGAFATNNCLTTENRMMATFPLYPKKAYGSNQAPYLVSVDSMNFKILPCSNVERDSFSNAGITPELNVGDTTQFPHINPMAPWTLLEKINIEENPRPTDPFITYALAKNACTGLLYVVEVYRAPLTPPALPMKTKTWQQPEDKITPLALLSSPNKHSYFSNWAIAPKSSSDRSLERLHRIAILWLEPNDHGLPSERLALYVYSVNFLGPICDIDSGTHIISRVSQAWPNEWEIDLEGNYIGKKWSKSYLEASSNEATINLVNRLMRDPRIYGKRICSLDPGMGGVAPQSSAAILSQSPPIQHDHSLLPNIGGIKLLGEACRQVMIWGLSPSQPCHLPQRKTITFSIFELSSERPARTNDFWHLGLCPFNLTGYDKHFYERRCSCYLHDYKYSVTLPRYTTSHGSRKSSLELPAARPLSGLSLWGKSPAPTQLKNENIILSDEEDYEGIVKRLNGKARADAIRNHSTKHAELEARRVQLMSVESDAQIKLWGEEARRLRIPHPLGLAKRCPEPCRRSWFPWN